MPVKHIPMTSRYKCMFEFNRPPAVLPDGTGGYKDGPSPGLTNCYRPKGHSGKHMNVRGETPDGDIMDAKEIIKKDYQSEK
jgi:hypothetical protein